MVGTHNRWARIIAASIEAVGGLIVAAALVWWGLVYYQVFQNTGFPILRAVPCLIVTSDTCSLAMSLCTGHHVFGLTRYSENLLWVGIVVAGASFLLRAAASGRSRAVR
jgi:hypothetical protein